MSQHDR